MSNEKEYFGPLPASDGYHDHADARTLLRALREGWPVTQAMRERSLKWAESVLNDETTHNKAKEYAVRVIQAADAHNLRVVEVADKIRRLDDPNGATERVVEVKRVILEGE